MRGPVRRKPIWSCGFVDTTIPDSAAPSASSANQAIWIIENKTDLRQGIKIRKSRLLNLDYRFFEMSAVTGAGIPALLDALGAFAADYFGTTENTLITRSRQRACLTELAMILRRITQRSSSDQAGDLEFLAEDLRLASRTIGRMTGRIDVEDVLDVIFRDFCIGK